MTPRDDAANYLAAIGAIRMRMVVEGRVLPREDDSLDLVLLAMMGTRDE